MQLLKNRSRGTNDHEHPNRLDDLDDREEWEEGPGAV